MYAGRYNKHAGAAREANFGAGLVIQEIMQTKPGRQDDYIRELERLYVPWSESTGKRWLGSFITTFRFNEVIHYWALDGDWDCFENHYPSWKDQPAGGDRHLDERGPGAARRLGGFDPAGPAAIAVEVSRLMNQACDAELLLRSVRPGGDGQPAARTTGAARRASGVLHREVGHLRAVAVRGRLACARSQRRNVRGVGGHTARGGCAGSTTTTGRSPIRALHPMPFHANFDSPIYEDVRRCTSAPVAAEVGDPSSPTGSARWPTNASTNCCRGAPSTSPRTTAASSQRRWSANWSACQPNSRPMCWPLSTPAAWPSRARGSRSANARPGYLGIPDARSSNAAAPPGPTEPADRRRPDRLPTARRLGVHRHRGGHPDARASSSAVPRPSRRSPPRAVGTVEAARPAGRGAC